jgi:predicted N-acetyltransferase YhbS
VTEPRRIAPEDLKALEEILVLLHVCFAYMDGRIDPPSSLHALTVSYLVKQAENGEVWAVGSPIVACVFLTEKTDCLYLGKLAVHAAERGNGLARKLVSLAENRARDMGKSYLELQTRIELVENHAAFAKLGFTRTATGKHPGFDRVTECTMRKRVTSSVDS